MVASTPNPARPERFQLSIHLRLLPIGMAIILACGATAASDEGADDDFIDNALIDQQVETGDLSVYDRVFGYGSNAGTARKQLERYLWRKIIFVDRLCGLTDAQKEKLQLAGRGDNKRVLECIEETGRQLQPARNDGAKVKTLLQNARSFKQDIGAGLSRDTKFVKSLERILEADQVVHYEPLRAVVSAGGTVHWRKGSDEVVEAKLTGTRFADDALVPLGELPGLQLLDLDGTQVTDAGLGHLKRLKNLRKLNLANTGITDAGLSHLSDLNELRELILTNTQVTDAGLAHLTKLTRLVSLGLKNTRVTDAGLRELSGHNRLFYLTLTKTHVTDDGLSHLKDLKSLEVLWLADTQVTPGGITELRCALPGLTVER